MLETDVLVVGSSLSGMMTTLNLKHRNPGLDVTVLGPLPSEEKRPLVGESLVEPGILFFREMGLGRYLDEMQVLKNGLTFYHKLDLSNPADRGYSVHAPEILFHKARQMRRHEFDGECRERAIALGARMLHGIADEVEIGAGGAKHRIVATVDGARVEIRSRWIVDATGRKRVIGKKVTRYVRPAEQRSTFWFRLRNFQPFFERLDAHRRRQWRFDPWLTTHHFLGRAYWIWCIPLEIGEENLCSIGFTYRPDLFGGPIRSMADFLAQVDKDHPALSDMVRSGEVVDTQMYLNYFYRSEDLYSEDGWFLVGDTARAVDPLYSNGISMTTVQVGQIAEIIERQRDGTLKPGDVASLDAAGRWIMERSQREVAEQYEIMHDPFQACMRRYLNVTGWFSGFLPLWWNGFFTTPEGARLLLRLFRDRDEDAESLRVLAAEASAAIGPPYTQQGFDRGPDLDALINLRFDCAREDMMKAVTGMFARRRDIRWKLLAMNGNKKLVREIPRLIGETIRPRLLRLLPRLQPAVFAAVRPPLPGQYERWTGPDRDVSEPEVPYVGRPVRSATPELTG
jgi:flavin-dependent dehydrogenase